MQTNAAQNTDDDNPPRQRTNKRRVDLPPKTSWTIRQYEYGSGFSRSRIYKLLNEGLLTSERIDGRRFVLSADPAADVRRIAAIKKAAPE